MPILYGEILCSDIPRRSNSAHNAPTLPIGACETGGMTMAEPTTAPTDRTPTKRSVLMCRPEYFTVSYRINPWMHPEEPTDTSLAVQQWDVLHQTYVDLGFDIHLIDPIAGLPDMVYAANGGFTLDNIAYGALFTYEERGPEGP